MNSQCLIAIYPQNTNATFHKVP